VQLLEMAHRYRRPAWVRRVNAMGRAAGSATAVVPLDASDLIDTARAQVEGGDFGELGDGDWEGRLRSLVTAIDGNDLHVVGRLMTREELLRGLRTRLLLAAHRRREPSVADEVIDAPIVITGPARSGTSILFELVALDPLLRSPVAADVLHPASGLALDERLSMAEAEQELWEDVQPEFASMHELRADLPVECITISSPSFGGSHWSMVLNDPGAWAPDIPADLAFHRAVLQSVQHREPRKRWVLKTPGYLFLLDDLLRAYPDACVVFTHRDPAKTMPSTVSTTAMVQWLRTDHVELDGLAALIGALFSDALNTVARRRDEGSIPAPCGDVRFMDLMADPVAAIDSAYSAIGRELTPAHAAAITDYLAAKPRGKHGVHRYEAADWGFEVGELRRDLQPYLDRFQIELED
jgi:hypothetical protein